MEQIPILRNYLLRGNRRNMFSPIPHFEFGQRKAPIVRHPNQSNVPSVGQTKIQLLYPTLTLGCLVDGGPVCGLGTFTRNLNTVYVRVYLAPTKTHATERCDLTQIDCRPLFTGRFAFPVSRFTAIRNEVRCVVVVDGT